MNLINFLKVSLRGHPSESPRLEPNKPIIHPDRIGMIKVCTFIFILILFIYIVASGTSASDPISQINSISTS